MNQDVVTRRLRVLYVVCDDDSGDFQSPKTSQKGIDSALKRIGISVQLLQTFLSEEIYKKFGIRKTFSLFDGEKLCQVYRTKIKINDALSMKSDELFLHLANEIQSDINMFDRNSKYVAVLSFTRFEKDNEAIDNIFTNTKGFCALGLVKKVFFDRCKWETDDRLLNF